MIIKVDTCKQRYFKKKFKLMIPRNDGSIVSLIEANIKYVLISWKFRDWSSESLNVFRCSIDLLSSIINLNSSLFIKHMKKTTFIY